MTRPTTIGVVAFVLTLSFCYFRFVHPIPKKIATTMLTDGREAKLLYYRNTAYEYGPGGLAVLKIREKNGSWSVENIGTPRSDQVYLRQPGLLDLAAVSTRDGRFHAIYDRGKTGFGFIFGKNASADNIEKACRELIANYPELERVFGDLL